jgi:predicted lipoprotein with Yx(FWY)xxD motif
MFLIALLALAAAAPDVPGSQVQVAQDGDVYIMRALIDNSPLYTFDQDQAGDQDRPAKSNCTDACAAAWRPLWAPENAEPIGKWTAVKRDDGASQWAYEGKPVYSFPQDPKSVAIGNGRVGTWHLLPTFPAQ